MEVYIVLIIFAAGALIPITGIYTSFLLKKEKIKADAMIRAEEIRARNRLDIEMLLKEREAKAENIYNTDYNDELSYSRDERQVREKQL